MADGEKTAVYDVIIVGAGAAGLAAAIFCARRSLLTLIISQDVGGQAATTRDIENYPGYDTIDGAELMQRYLAQAKKSGAEFVLSDVLRVEPESGGKFATRTPNETYHSRSVILAFGLTHRHLGVPGEDKLVGRGVSYCCTGGLPNFKNKRVAVVGGGSSAVDSALLLAAAGNNVILIQDLPQLTAEAVLIERLKAEAKISVKVSSKVHEISGKSQVESITIGPGSGSGENETLPVDGVFIEIGYQVKPDLVKGVVELDARKQIVISRDCETSVPGIFAAGDVTTITYKQVVISAGEGAKAALKTYQYLSAQQGGRPVRTDWGKVKKN